MRRGFLVAYAFLAGIEADALFNQFTAGNVSPFTAFVFVMLAVACAFEFGHLRAA